MGLQGTREILQGSTWYCIWEIVAFSTTIEAQIGVFLHFVYGFA